MFKIDLHHKIRIYTPLILSIFTLLNALMFISEREYNYQFAYITANLTGSSLLLDYYILSVSKRMCIWYKLNILCLILSHINGLVYNVIQVYEFLYPYIIITLSSIGIVFFMIFRIFYKTIKNKKGGR